ncbi:MAG: hypothetical protein AAGC70_03730, partial [Pseudomonadota bacterium]
ALVVIAHGLFLAPLGPHRDGVFAISTCEMPNAGTPALGVGAPQRGGPQSRPGVPDGWPALK